jgi:hypothetical protein
MGSWRSERILGKTQSYVSMDGDADAGAGRESDLSG